MTAPRKRHPAAASLPLAAIALGLPATAAWMPRPTPLLPARAHATALPVGSKSIGISGRVNRGPTPTSTLVGVSDLAPSQLARSVSAPGIRPTQQPRITLNLENAPIARLLDAFSKYWYYKIITSTNVHGTVTGGCVNFYVDGTSWQTVMPDDIDLYVRPAQVVAVKAYPRSSTPRQFALENQDRCATIVIWTRGRVRPD